MVGNLRLSSKLDLIFYLNKMIPKIIHYCWFGSSPKSAFINSCIETWKKHLPEYEIRCWSENDFDFDSVQFVREAYQMKKWAFVADYVRFYALHEVGGIYMDTDVKVLRPFREKWFRYDFFSSHEYHPGLFDLEGVKKLNEFHLPKNIEDNIDGFALFSALMASKPKHPYLKDCLQVYNAISFLNLDGSYKKVSEVIIGEIITKAALKYGYVYQDKEQVLKENMLILTSNFFVGNAALLDKNSYAIHLCNGDWAWEEKTPYNRFLYTLRNDYPRVYPLFNFSDRVIKKVSRTINGFL